MKSRIAIQCLAAVLRHAVARGLLFGLAAVGLSVPAHALPLFARQTGQNCMACHAGGQFPELTPYGRLFKLTGYTIGQRTTPLSAMVLASNSRVANTSKSDDPGQDFQENAKTILATASLFAGGKVTNNVGAFVQATYDPYATQSDDGHFHGRLVADNMELRYADRLVDARRDFIWGLSLNNNPSVSDPWNTAPAWMQYVPVPSPTSSRFIDGAAPYPGYAAGSNIAGLTAYAFWNRTIYAELGAYGTSRGPLSVMHAGLHADEVTKLAGLNPYWRLAWNHEWGPHSLMVGTSGMLARIYDDPLDTSDPATLHHTRDLVLDAQYQYLLDPHSVTAQLVFENSRHRYPDALANQPAAFVDASGNALPNTNAQDTTNLLRAKLTYVYQARYGGSVGWFNLTGSSNTANQTSGYSPDTLTITSNPAVQAPSLRVGGSLNGNPATRGATLEAFWMPIQYMRLGVQYTAYSRYNGASNNYDGFGRNARDNNSVFVYLWAAYSRRGRTMQAWKPIASLAALLALAGCAEPTRSRDTADPRVPAITLAQQVCSNCHGVTGVTVSPNFPHLAAQTPEYIVAQLKAFQGHHRQDPAGFEYMWGLSRSLTDEQMRGLAAYYAAQAPAPGQHALHGDPQRGASIYRTGLPDHGVPACAGCHGTSAQGNGAFPRLAGQHADYVVKQLMVFQRTDQRPEGAVMKGVAHDLRGEDMRDVAAYLEGAPAR